MAQLVEHILGKDEVISSTLITSSRKGRSAGTCLFRFLQGIVRFQDVRNAAERETASIG